MIERNFYVKNYTKSFHRISINLIYIAQRKVLKEAVNSLLLGPEYKSRTFIPKEIIFFQSKTLSGSTRLFEKTVAIWRHLFGSTHLIGGGGNLT